MAKAVGVGGIFLRATEPKKLMSWYVEHLGIPGGEGGYTNFDGPEAQGMTVFSFFPENSEYMGEQTQRAMVNFRVDDLDGVLARLEAAGAKIDPKREDYGYGRFAWFWDPEGNRVELWEPKDE
ncbi:MAG TPA: VOC family protein [Acidobacteriaceae bacterium]|nr:VOC family protein [Acidobacteriaceae bacterium]